MSNYKQNFGKSGEQIAADFLQKKGFQIIEQNYFTQYGEIDLIAKDRKEWVFVEVKTRKSKEYGEPEEAITPFKKKHLISTARIYLQKEKLNENEVNWRIDVIAIMFYPDKEPEINYIENAVAYF